MEFVRRDGNPYIRRAFPSLEIHRSLRDAQQHVAMLQSMDISARVTTLKEAPELKRVGK
jgi:hypothetical protein